jgi:hypothetical protein
MKTALTLELVLLGTALVCVLAVPVAAQQAARGCAAMGVPGFTTPTSPPTPPSPPGPGLVPVSLPVVVHYMKTVGSPHDAAARLRTSGTQCDATISSDQAMSLHDPDDSRYWMALAWSTWPE